MTDKLIRMATQMADFFRSQPGIRPEQAVAGHINDFWTYRMRADLLDLLRAGAQADPVVAAAAPHIHLPTPAADGAGADPPSRE